MLPVPRSHQLRPRAAHGTCTHGLRLHRVCDNANVMSITATMVIAAVCTAQNITFVPHCRRHGIVAHTRSVAHSAGYKLVSGRTVSHDSHHYYRLVTEQMHTKCFERCISRPGASLSSSETTCMSNCIDFNLEVSRATIRRA